MDMTELFKHFGSLFETFSWWSILLIAGVILIMIPINMLLKKMMKDEKVERLRKIVAFVSVYVVAVGAVALFTSIATETAITVNYLFGSSLALGFCAQFGWEIIKLIRDYGFKKFIAWISTKVEVDKIVNQISTKYSVDKQLIKVLVEEAKEKLTSNTDIADIDAAFTSDCEIMNNVQERLSALVSSENLSGITTELYDLIKETIK
ncbi:MAG: hypothetical protein RR342_00995 [Bacilli bacterium]